MSAFRAAAQAGVLDWENSIQEIPIADPPIPSMRNVRLATVLRTILDRIPGESKTTYIIHSDVIEITTQDFKDAEERAPKKPLSFPLINLEFDKKPLADALQELAETSGISVVLDSRADNASGNPVTTKLRDVPLDTAVRLLADMAGLRPVRMDNVLYVTTRENAKLLQEEQEERTLGKPDAKTEDQGTVTDPRRGRPARPK